MSTKGSSKAKAYSSLSRSKTSLPSRKTTPGEPRSSMTHRSSLLSQGITVLAARSAKASVARVSIESSLERACRLVVKRKGGIFLKLTSFVGIPDRLMLLPNGEVIFVELKRPCERPRKIQLHWLGALNQLGFLAVTMTAVADIGRLLNALSAAGHSGYRIASERMSKTGAQSFFFADTLVKWLEETAQDSRKAAKKKSGKGR